MNTRTGKHVNTRTHEYPNTIYIMKRAIIIFPILFFSILASAQNEHKSLKNGDSSYKQGNYTQAEEEYLRATEDNPNSVKGHFNRGNSIYKSIDPTIDPEQLDQRLSKAAEEYLTAIEHTTDKETKAQAYHNLGNTYIEKKDFAKGLEAYKNALRNNPNDMDTKRNLMYALRQMQQQQQQEQQQQSGEGEEGEPQEPQEGQEQQEPQEGDESQEPQEGQEGQEEEQEQESDQEQQSQGNQQDKEEQASPEEKTEEEILRQLKVMDDEEKKVQEKLRKEQQSDYRSEKDW